MTMNFAQPITLLGRFVSLEPLEKHHRELLRVLASEPSISTYFPFPISEDGFDNWFDAALTGLASKQAYPFVVKEIATGNIIGSTRYYDIDAKHHTLSIGYTWYIPAVWGTCINPETKLLLLTQAFEVCKAHRVVFYVDARNARSRAAVKKLGAK